jgi:hypothetical protein
LPDATVIKVTNGVPQDRSPQVSRQMGAPVRPSCPEPHRRPSRPADVPWCSGGSRPRT